MNTAEWIRRLEGLRASDELIGRGQWHGYKGHAEPLMRGEYVLVRWERPYVAIAHDDPDQIVALARHLERALGEPCAVCGYEGTCGDPPGEDCHS